MREKSRIIVKRPDCNIGTIKDISIIPNKFGEINSRGRKRTDRRVREVIWKNGSNLSLVEGIDEFQILDR